MTVSTCMLAWVLQRQRSQCKWFIWRRWSMQRTWQEVGGEWNGSMANKGTIKRWAPQWSPVGIVRKQPRTFSPEDPTGWVVRGNGNSLAFPTCWACTESSLRLKGKSPRAGSVRPPGCGLLAWHCLLQSFPPFPPLAPNPGELSYKCLSLTTRGIRWRRTGSSR